MEKRKKGSVKYELRNTGSKPISTIERRLKNEEEENGNTRYEIRTETNVEHRRPIEE